MKDFLDSGERNDTPSNEYLVRENERISELESQVRELTAQNDEWKMTVGYAGRAEDPGSLQGFIEGLWAERQELRDTVERLERELGEVSGDRY